MAKQRGLRRATLTAVVISTLTTGVVLHSRVPAAEAALSPFARLVNDSARADSAAFSALPPRLRPMLDVRSLLDSTSLAALPLAECTVLEDGPAAEMRRRLHLRLPDSSVVVLYATADEMTGGLLRVEFIRRTPHEGQRGIIWDHERDQTSSMWWTEVGRRRRAERGGIPRGGPVPRAVRALGRQLVMMPCAESAERTPR